jgi:hypothetical protein
LNEIGSGFRACGNPGALVLRRFGNNSLREDGAKNLFAPTARKRGPCYHF